MYYHDIHLGKDKIYSTFNKKTPQVAIQTLICISKYK